MTRRSLLLGPLAAGLAAMLGKTPPTFRWEAIPSVGPRQTIGTKTLFRLKMRPGFEFCELYGPVLYHSTPA